MRRIPHHPHAKVYSRGQDCPEARVLLMNCSSHLCTCKHHKDHPEVTWDRVHCCNVLSVQSALTVFHVRALRTVSRLTFFPRSSSVPHFTSSIVCVCSAGNAVKKKQSRKRLIIQQPSNGGQECPELLEEEKDCEVPKVCPGFRYNCGDATFLYSMDTSMIMYLHQFITYGGAV